MAGKKDQYTVLGLMSGTSLDGVDLACCRFRKKNGKWLFELLAATTVKYSSNWNKRLTAAHMLPGHQLVELDASYGKYLGELCKAFLAKHKIAPDFISSHGHTIFHQPSNGFTYQLGNGQAIYSITALPVVYDFRMLDVLRGGQGAPLVPIGDKHLFSEYDVCLNIGGIANLSADVSKSRVAYDICFANMGFNYLAQKVGKPFDKNGEIASGGELNKRLLNQLNRVYKPLEKRRPSLGREFFDRKIAPLLDQYSPEESLASMVESTAIETLKAVRALKKRRAKVLCTGGGSHNPFLISRMLEHGGDDFTLIIPEQEIIDFKEAIVFGFLGVLRIRDEINCLKSVTGASQDSSSGILVGF